jgi:hypothetical protein
MISTFLMESYTKNSTYSKMLPEILQKFPDADCS